MEATRADLEKRMLERVRRHVVTSLGGLVVAMALAVGLGAVYRSAAGGGAPRAGLLVAFLLAIVAVPAIGLYSSSRNLRCPSCERGVAQQAITAITTGSASRSCAGCGAKIFGDDLAPRARRIFLVLFVIGLAVGIAKVLFRG